MSEMRDCDLLMLCTGLLHYSTSSNCLLRCWLVGLMYNGVVRTQTAFVSADARNTLTEGCFCLSLLWPPEASRGFDPERRSVMVPGHSNTNRLSSGQR